MTTGRINQISIVCVWSFWLLFWFVCFLVCMYEINHRTSQRERFLVCFVLTSYLFGLTWKVLKAYRSSDLNFFLFNQAFLQTSTNLVINVQHWVDSGWKRALDVFHFSKSRGFWESW